MSSESLAKARAAKAAKRAAAAAAPVPAEPAATAPTDDEAVRARRAALLAELADLPSEPAPASLPAGTVVHSGTIREDKTIFTRADFESKHKMIDVISPVTIPVNVNGVKYELIAGQPTKIPEPHYLVLMEHLDTEKRINAQFRPPTRDEIDRALAEGMYISPVHKMGVGPLPARSE